MKIIARTGDGYLVEASGGELASAAGYGHPKEIPGWLSERYDSWRGHIPIGTVIEASRVHEYLSQLRKKEAEIKQCEGMLRALADMLARALPTTVIPPAPIDSEFAEVGEDK